MKRLITLALVAILILTVAGCANLSLPAALPILGDSPSLTNDQIAAIIVALAGGADPQDIIASELLGPLEGNDIIEIIAALSQFESLTPEEQMALITRILALVNPEEE